jgi:hypothetical protein
MRLLVLLLGMLVLAPLLHEVIDLLFIDDVFLPPSSSTPPIRSAATSSCSAR